MRKRRMRAVALATAMACAPLADARAESDARIEALQRTVEQLAEQNRAMQRALEALRNEVAEARGEARAAQDEARAARRSPELVRAAWVPPPAAPAAARDGAIVSKQVGRANFQLLDVSLDVLTALGGSTASDPNLELLEAGEHDPRQRGFTLQQVELSFLGAVDPYFHGEAHLIYFLDPQGESRFEIEEAFATTRRLPFGAEELGLQLEIGTFFTEFGRINPQHAHAWDWQDQPVVLSRFFGGDGIRGPGLRLGWLTPLPWYSELYAGIQNCRGETMVSFCANEEVFATRPIGGRPFGDPKIQGPGDFTWLLRWVNGFDVSDTTSSQVGVSSLFGQNATGGSGWTSVVGGDVVVKWSPLDAERGWPFLELQAEAMGRWYDAAASFDPAFVPSQTLEDWGFYAQLLWGFRRGWSAGLRGEQAGGSGANVAFVDDGMGGVTAVPVSRQSDPFRGDRVRISPLLVYQPTEFSRLRLQYNFDDAKFLAGDTAHSVWAGLEILFGAHPAHAY